MPKQVGFWIGHQQGLISFQPHPKDNKHAETSSELQIYNGVTNTWLAASTITVGSHMKYMSFLAVASCYACPTIFQSC